MGNITTTMLILGIYTALANQYSGSMIDSYKCPSPGQQIDLLWLFGNINLGFENKYWYMAIVRYFNGCSGVGV